LRSRFPDYSPLFSISGHIRVKNHRITHNGELVYKAQVAHFDAFAEGFYRWSGTGYSKFHKMDRLCKLGFMAAEILLRDKELTKQYDPFEIGVFLANHNSSIDTDIRHQRQIESGPASPAVFVYSLPNIVIGEICIRHGIKGENTFFIDQEFNIAHQVQYITHLLNSDIINVAIGGWVEWFDDNYEAFLYLVEKSSPSTDLSFDETTLNKLYHNTYG
jgi:hypothetical protein